MSVWGKDFNPEAHAEIVRQGEEAEYLPTVDIYLPVCNEPLVLLANTWNYVHALDYPRATVHVLDDGAKDDVRDLAAEHGFKCERMMYKEHTSPRITLVGLPYVEINVISSGGC